MAEVQLSLDLCRPTLQISYNLLTILITIIVSYFLFQWYSNSYLIMLHYAKTNDLLIFHNSSCRGLIICDFIYIFKMSFLFLAHPVV